MQRASSTGSSSTCPRVRPLESRRPLPLRRPSELHRLIDASPALERILTRGGDAHVHYPVSAIKCDTTYVPMRDGTPLATDLYLPPELPAPVIVMRTPYGRAIDRHVGPFFSMARRGYVVVSQDCRGT